MDAIKIEGRTAVITGAASGIGRAIAIDAAGRGMKLAIADVNAEGLEETAQAARAKGATVITQVLDVRSVEAVEAFAKAAFDTGSVALVFANAGIIRLFDGTRPDLKAWDDIIDINLKGVVHMIHAFLATMIDRAEPAQFIITGSQASFTAGPQISPYIATKHAVWGLADALRLELAMQGNDNVGITLLAPGRVRSAITDASRERARVAGGDAGADKYDDGLITAEQAAGQVLDRAIAREFLSLPSGEPLTHMVKQRFEEVLAAEEPCRFR